MASEATFPLDVVELIIDEVALNRPFRQLCVDPYEYQWPTEQARSDLRSLCFVSRGWARIAKRSLRKRLSIDLTLERGLGSKPLVSMAGQATSEQLDQPLVGTDDPEWRFDTGCLLDFVCGSVFPRLRRLCALRVESGNHLGYWPRTGATFRELATLASFELDVELDGDDDVPQKAVTRPPTSSGAATRDSLVSSSPLMLTLTTSSATASTRLGSSAASAWTTRSSTTAEVPGVFLLSSRPA